MFVLSNTIPENHEDKYHKLIDFVNDTIGNGPM